MFPCFGEIVTRAAAFERHPRLDVLESSIERLAALHPEIEVWPPGLFRAGRLTPCFEIPAGPLQAGPRPPVPRGAP